MNHIEGESTYQDCGVNEDMFPCMGKCCSKSDAAFMSSYEKLCPDCEISASLPEGASLKIATIFECQRFGYGKRVME